MREREREIPSFRILKTLNYLKINILCTKYEENCKKSIYFLNKELHYYKNVKNALTLKDYLNYNLKISIFLYTFYGNKEINSNVHL